MFLGLKHYKDDVLILSSISGAIQMLQLAVKKNKLQLSVKQIEIKLNWKKYGNLGFILSPNRAFIGFLMCPSESRTKRIKNYKLVIFEDKCIKPFSMLMKKQFKYITDYWDYFEVLR